MRRAPPERPLAVPLTIGAIAGLAVGLLVALTTDVPLAPEAGLVLGLLGGWLASVARR